MKNPGNDRHNFVGLQNYERTEPDTTQVRLSNCAWEHIWKPACNAAFIAPYNATCNVVNAVVGSLLHKADQYSLQEVQLGTIDWIAQTASSALAGTVPYVVVGQLAGGLSRKGRALFNGGGLPQSEIALLQRQRWDGLFANQQYSNIAGAVLYDGLRDPHAGETRLGNMIGGAAAFSIFARAGSASHSLANPLDRLAHRLGTGAVAGLAQGTTSRLVAEQRMPDSRELGGAVVSSALMSAALPSTHRFAERAIDRVNLLLGRGIPINRVLGELPAAPASSTLNKLARDNPLCRVQFGGTEYSVDHARNVVHLPHKGLSADKLGHELQHLDPLMKVRDEARFKIASSLLGKNGDAEAYLNIRSLQEMRSKLTEARIDHETATPKRHPQARDTPEDWQPSSKHEALWKKEFEVFKQLRGAFRPQTDYADPLLPRDAWAELRPHVDHRVRYLGRPVDRELRNNIMGLQEYFFSTPGSISAANCEMLKTAIESRSSFNWLPFARLCIEHKLPAHILTELTAHDFFNPDVYRNLATKGDLKTIENLITFAPRTREALEIILQSMTRGQEPLLRLINNDHQAAGIAAKLALIHYSAAPYEHLMNHVYETRETLPRAFRNCEIVGTEAWAQLVLRGTSSRNAIATLMDVGLGASPTSLRGLAELDHKHLQICQQAIDQGAITPQALEVVLCQDPRVRHQRIPIVAQRLSDRLQRSAPLEHDPVYEQLIRDLCRTPGSFLRDAGICADWLHDNGQPLRAEVLVGRHKLNSGPKSNGEGTAVDNAMTEKWIALASRALLRDSRDGTFLYLAERPSNVHAYHELGRYPFQGKDLRLADFQSSWLEGSSFKGANVEGANFANANLNRAIMSMESQNSAFGMYSALGRIRR